MPDSPSDFVSFQDYLGLNEDELRAAIEKANASVGQYDKEQQDALRQAGYEAGRTGTPMQQTASYGQFLNARDKARSAYEKAQRGIAPSLQERQMLEALGLDVSIYDPSGLANEMRNRARDEYGRQLDANEESETQRRREEMDIQSRNEKVRQASGGLSTDDMMRRQRINRMFESDPNFKAWGHQPGGFQPAPGSELAKILAQPGHPDHKAAWARYMATNASQDAYNEAVGGPFSPAYGANPLPTGDQIAARNKLSDAYNIAKSPYWQQRVAAGNEQYRNQTKSNEGWQSEAAKKRKSWEDAWGQSDLTWEY